MAEPEYCTKILFQPPAPRRIDISVTNRNIFFVTQLPLKSWDFFLHLRLFNGHIFFIADIFCPELWLINFPGFVANNIGKNYTFRPFKFCQPMLGTEFNHFFLFHCFSRIKLHNRHRYFHQPRMRVSYYGHIVNF